MKKIFHKADSRGYADHGWLKSYHTFSFANYFNPERVRFGALRVLNDDYVEGNNGFGRHPHQNMEIISIPLAGEMRHGDTTGNHGVIGYGDIQVMSAGTGIYHSEMNASKTLPVKFLQIWVMPREQNLKPRYGQIKMSEVKNEFQQIVSPNPKEQDTWINQDAWFNMAQFDQGVSKTYKMHLENQGVYIFVIEGSLEVEGQAMNARDGLGIWETSEINITATSDAEFLVMEIPMR